MTMQFDRRKSLQELENHDWGDPDFDSHLVRTCHRLRRVPLAKLAVEDLRLLIGQKIGLAFLLPLAIEKLAENRQAEGDCYPGDLLDVVRKVPNEFWNCHAELKNAFRVFSDEILRDFD